MSQNDEEITLETYGICRHHSGIAQQLSNLTDWQRSQNGHLASIDAKMDSAASREELREVRGRMDKLMFSVLGVGISILVAVLVGLITGSL